MYSISDTGPLISAFQSDSFALLTRIFPIVFIPPACADELVRHGWENEMSDVSNQLVIPRRIISGRTGWNHFGGRIKSAFGNCCTTQLVPCTP